LLFLSVCSINQLAEKAKASCKLKLVTFKDLKKIVSLGAIAQQQKKHLALDSTSGEVNKDNDSQLTTTAGRQTVF
jgi:hypothetical protein